MLVEQNKFDTEEFEKDHKRIKRVEEELANLIAMTQDNQFQSSKRENEIDRKIQNLNCKISDLMESRREEGSGDKLDLAQIKQQIVDELRKEINF